MKKLTPEVIMEIVRKHLTPMEAGEMSKVFSAKPEIISALSQFEQHKFTDEQDVVAWLRRITKQAKGAGVA